MHRVMSLAENYCFDKSASIAFDWSNAIWAKPKPLLQAERENKSGKPKCPLFFCWINEIVVEPR